jgi:hypothetical protein
MHREYGPIVRINPHEVHFADPELLNTLYPVSGRKTDKPSVYALITGSKPRLYPFSLSNSGRGLITAARCSVESTIHHELHR